MRCPVCSTPLIVVERDSIEVDYCIECHGLWFDQGEIELLGELAGMAVDLERIEHEHPSVSGERYRNCPRCSKKMRKVDLLRGRRVLVVDFCPRGHGIWFDRGETGDFMSGFEPQADPVTTMITSFLGEAFGSPGASEGS